MKKLKTLRRQLLLQYLVTVGLLLGGGEVLFYAASRWAGQRELDTALQKDIERLASAVELERDGDPEIEGEHDFDKVQIYGRTSDWQVIMANGSTLGRSRRGARRDRDLPAIGGANVPVQKLQIANASYGPWGMVRAARLVTFRRHIARGGRIADEPRQMHFDIRAVVDRTALDAQLRSLAWYLACGFPMAMGLAAAGGYYLIERAIRPVESAFRRERRFAGAASHELRTPLTALRGEIDVTLRHERTTAEYVQAIRRMDTLVGRMTGLVEGLLILARADAGHLLLGTSELTVADLETAVDGVIAQLPGREQVTTTCTAPKDVKIYGDGLLLAIAVRNLVENALLHARAATVRVAFAESGDGRLEIRVEDDGRGIPPDVLAALVGKTLVEIVPGHRAGGAGLGLSITRAVVESHGGTLLLENLPHSGCRATIRLPGSVASVDRSVQRESAS